MLTDRQNIQTDTQTDIGENSASATLAARVVITFKTA